MEKHCKFTCHFTGTCHKCHRTIQGCDSACKAMGNLYHARCFECSICEKELKGQEFYSVKGKIYCKDDFKESKYNLPPKTCFVCGDHIGDKILITLGRSYHPTCFRCCECNIDLEGIPFTVDEQNNVFCVPDYHRKHSPRCDWCKQPITPKGDSDEIIRVVCNGKQYHPECFKCEDCGISLSNEEGRQCYPIENRLYCINCNEQRLTLASSEQHATTMVSNRARSSIRQTKNPYQGQTPVYLNDSDV